MFLTDMEDFGAVRVDVVRWPRDTAADHARVGVVTVNYNTAPLIALLLWSLYQVLDTSMLEQVVVVDNGSTDGSAQLLSGLTEASLCHLVANAENRSHGPGINQGISYLRSEHTRLAAGRRGSGSLTLTAWQPGQTRWRPPCAEHALAPRSLAKASPTPGMAPIASGLTAC